MKFDNSIKALSQAYQELLGPDVTTNRSKSVNPSLSHFSLTIITSLVEDLKALWVRHRVLADAIQHELWGLQAHCKVNRARKDASQAIPRILETVSKEAQRICDTPEAGDFTPEPVHLTTDVEQGVTLNFDPPENSFPGSETGSPKQISVKKWKQAKIVNGKLTSSRAKTSEVPYTEHIFSSSSDTATPFNTIPAPGTHPTRIPIPPKNKKLARKAQQSASSKSTAGPVAQPASTMQLHQALTPSQEETFDDRFERPLEEPKPKPSKRKLYQ